MQVDQGRRVLPVQAELHPPAPPPSTPCPCNPPPASVHTAGLALGHRRCHPAVRSWTVCMNDGAALIHAVFLCTASSLPGGTDPTFPSIPSATRPVYPPRGDDRSPASAQSLGWPLVAGTCLPGPHLTAAPPAVATVHRTRVCLTLAPPGHSRPLLPLVFSSDDIWKTTILKQNCILIFLTATSRVSVSPLKTSKGLPPGKEGL